MDTDAGIQSRHCDHQSLQATTKLQWDANPTLAQDKTEFLFIGVMRIKSHKALKGIGTGCPGRWWSHHPWRGSKNVYVWHFGAWFSRHGWGDGWTWWS